MAKKKKGKKKKGKKKSSADDDGAAAIAAAAKVQADKIDKELEVSLLLYQLAELKQRYQEACKENTAHSKGSIADTKANKDMEFFLNQKLDDNYNEIDRLEKTLLNLESEKEISDNDWQKRLNQETTSLKTELSAATNELNRVQQELIKLKDFQKKKDTMELQISTMEVELSSVREATAKQLVNLDKRRVREKQQLEQEYKQKIEDAKRDSRARSQAMLHDTTRKAMQDNSRMSAELKFQSKAMEKLMSTNEQLVGENTRLRQEIEMHKQIQLEFAKKTQVYQRLLRKLNEKIQVKEDRERINAQKMLLRDKELSDELLSTDEVMSRLNQKVRTLEDTLKRKGQQVERMRVKLRHHLQGEAQMQHLTNETVSLLLAAMEDIKHQIATDPATLFEPEDYSVRGNQGRGSMGKQRGNLSVRGQGPGPPPSQFMDLSSRGRVKILELLLSQLQSKKITLLMKAQTMAQAMPEGTIGLPPLMGLSTVPSVRAEQKRRKDMRITTTSTQTDAQELAMMTPVRPGMVHQPLREWGSRASELPLTKHSQDTFLKRGKGKVSARQKRNARQ